MPRTQTSLRVRTIPPGSPPTRTRSADGTVLGDSYGPVVHQVGEPESSTVGHDRGGDAVEAEASREVGVVAPQQHEAVQRHRDTHARPADGEPRRGSREGNRRDELDRANGHARRGDGPTTLDGGVTGSLDAATTEPEADDAAREAERGDRNEDDLKRARARRPTERASRRRAHDPSTTGRGWSLKSRRYRRRLRLWVPASAGACVAGSAGRAARDRPACRSWASTRRAWTSDSSIVTLPPQ